MGESPNQTFRKTAFYGDAYVPTYSPITLMTHADREHTNAIGDGENNDLMLIGAEGGRQSPGAQHDNSFGIHDENGDMSGFDQTLYENGLLHSQVKIEDNGVCDSQPPPNQEFITHIDTLYDDCPLETYIERLLSYTTEKEGILSWYRMILISRLRGHSDNPLFQAAPVTRKSTHRSSSSYKYAKDCYRLLSFMSGDMTSPVDDIFSSRAPKPSQSEQREQCQDQGASNRVETTTLKQLVQSLRLEIAEIKSSCTENIKTMQTKISVLEKENKSLKESLLRIDNEYQNKVTIHDSKIRQISASIKDLENINPFEVNTKLDSLEASQRRIESSVNRLKVASSKQSLTERVTKNGNPSTLPSSSLNSSSPGQNETINVREEAKQPRNITSVSSRMSPTQTSTSSGVHVIGDGNRCTEQRVTPAIHNNNSWPWEEVVPSFLRRQGTSTDASRDGTSTSCHVSGNFTTTADARMLNTSSTSSANTVPPPVNHATKITYQTQNGISSTHATINNNECQVPEVAPSDPIHVIPRNSVGYSQQGPMTYNPLQQFMPTMYGYPFRMPYGANVSQNLQNAPLPSQFQAGIQQVPHPLFMQASTQQLLQNQCGDFNNKVTVNNANECTDGDRPLNHSIGNESPSGQSSHRETMTVTNLPESGSDQNQQQSETQESDDVFIGAYRKRYIKYFVSNIDERSTRNGILSHFKDNGVIISDLSLHKSKSGNCYAKVTIERKYKEAIESNDFDWPAGVYCNYWKTNTNSSNRRSRQTERHNRK